MPIISESQVKNRRDWINRIIQLSGNFGVDAERIEDELSSEIKINGTDSLINHLRLCGAIPERYSHDSSEEKLYSKYTDVVIHEAFKAMGFTSIVLKERSGYADVECVTEEYSFVADAKAFRLSRTAKNQKDFKVQAMDNWKHGKPYATVVSPVYQLPSRTSQIYRQAATRSVLISTYTHLAVIVRYAVSTNVDNAIGVLQKIFQSVDHLNPSKSAADYWRTINSTLLSFDPVIAPLWREEKLALAESITLSKTEALEHLASERERIMRLSRDEAISEILKSSRVENRIRAINKVSDNRILDKGEE